MHVPERLRVKMHTAVAFIGHVVAHDGLNVLHNLCHVFTDSGHDIWPPAAKSIHVFQKLRLVPSSMLPVQQPKLTEYRPNDTCCRVYDADRGED